MNFEQIKKWILENKKIVIIGLGLLVIGVFFKVNNGEKADHSNLINNEEVSFQSKSSKQSGRTDSDNSSTNNTKSVTVDISGAVKNGGVYTLKNGARVQELIDAAGGLSSRAQVKAINRAIMLKDQDKIYIPYKGEKIAANNALSANQSDHGSTDSDKSQSGNANKVNLNTASASELQKLNGIGEKKAEQIIAYREQKGEFKKIEDLMQVSGIGEKTFAALKDQLAI